MTGGLDGSSQETERLMSERKAQETLAHEQSKLRSNPGAEPKLFWFVSSE